MQRQHTWKAECRLLAAIAMVLVLACGRAAAQPSSGLVTGAAVIDRDSGVAEGDGSGWIASVALAPSYDAQSGWSVFTSPAVAYRANRIFSFDASLPVASLIDVQQTTPAAKGRAATETTVTRYGELGDAVFGGHAHFAGEQVEDTVSLALTAATGEKAAGLSAGKATYFVSDHVEKSMGPLTPELEFGVGTGSGAVRRRVKKNYTSAGDLVSLQAGFSTGVWRASSLELDAYEQLPIGAQTVYRRKGKKHRPIVSNAASDAEDNGATLNFDLPLARRLTASINYSHSIRQQDDSVGLTVNVILLAPRQTVR